MSKILRLNEPSRSNSSTDCTRCGQPCWSKDSVCGECKGHKPRKNTTTSKPTTQKTKRRIHNLHLNFSNHNKAMDALKRIAARQIRTTEEQAIYFILKGIRQDVKSYKDVQDYDLEDSQVPSS